MREVLDERHERGLRGDQTEIAPCHVRGVEAVCGAWIRLSWERCEVPIRDLELVFVRASKSDAALMLHGLLNDLEQGRERRGNEDGNGR